MPLLEQLLGPQDDQPETKSVRVGFWDRLGHGLLGATDGSEDSHPSAGVRPAQVADHSGSLWDRLVGPQDESGPAGSQASGAPRVQTEAASPSNGGKKPSWVGKLLGPLDEYTQAQAEQQAEQERLKGKGIGGLAAPFVALASVAAQSAQEYRRQAGAQAARAAQPQAPPQPPREASRFAERERGFSDWRIAIEGPRSTWGDLPHIVEARARIARLPKWQQVTAARNEIDRMIRRNAEIARTEVQRFNSGQVVAMLRRRPLSTATFTSYDAFMEGLYGQPTPPDLSWGVVGAMVRGTSSAVRRWIDRWVNEQVADLSLETPVKLLQGARGVTHIEVTSTTSDDQAIFFGDNLVLINLQRTPDTIPVAIDQIYSTLDIGVEGPPLLAAVNGLRSTFRTGREAGGEGRNNILIRNTGRLVISPKGKAGEYVSVAISDPYGFQRALRELVEVCKGVRAPAQSQMAVPLVRDLLYDSSDDPRYRERQQGGSGRGENQQRAEPRRRRAPRPPDIRPWVDDLEEAGDTVPKEQYEDVRARLHEAERQLRMLKRGLPAPGDDTTTDEDPPVEGVWRVLGPDES